ncbi:MAG TPA: hypothetical protein VHZ55_33495, partial [Bryobacteraceae bacterium]|nr:hypothetical protein [Bryobacteraceae bacterium]
MMNRLHTRSQTVVVFGLIAPQHRSEPAIAKADEGPRLEPHLGIASLNLGFGGEDHSGTYHSAYDNPWFEDHFGDTNELYGRALAQT